MPGQRLPCANTRRLRFAWPVVVRHNPVDAFVSYLLRHQRQPKFLANRAYQEAAHGMLLPSLPSGLLHDWGDRRTMGSDSTFESPSLARTRRVSVRLPRCGSWLPERNCAISPTGRAAFLASFSHGRLIVDRIA
jgi:hypothetical protein